MNETFFANYGNLIGTTSCIGSYRALIIVNLDMMVKIDSLIISNGR